MNTDEEWRALRDLAISKMNKYVYDGDPSASVVVTLQSQGEWWEATVRDRYDAVYCTTDPMPTYDAAVSALRKMLETK